MFELSILFNKLVKLFTAVGLILVFSFAQAQERQTLSLTDVFQISQQNYPAIKQKDLIRQTNALTLKNLSTGFLPQLTINAQASYQSDYTRVNIPVPGVKIPTQSKDQYRVIADVNQLIFDGGVIKNQQNIQQLNVCVEESRVEVELHDLKNRVSFIYFGILYQDELLKQTELVIKDIQMGIDKAKLQVENRVALR